LVRARRWMSDRCAMIVMIAAFAGDRITSLETLQVLSSSDVRATECL